LCKDLDWIHLLPGFCEHEGEQWGVLSKRKEPFHHTRNSKLSSNYYWPLLQPNQDPRTGICKPGDQHSDPRKAAGILTGW
jgi:hypothetical protein